VRNNTNLGVATTRNKGIQLARGERFWTVTIGRIPGGLLGRPPFLITIQIMQQ
jgi:hypothetical protein